MKASTRGQIEAAVVKTSLSRYAVRCLPLVVARDRIREAASRAVRRSGEIAPLRFPPPITLEVDFSDRQIARYVSWMPQTRYDGDSTISYTAGGFLSIYKALLAMFWIATSQLNP
jgi:D-amino peptidase